MAYDIKHFQKKFKELTKENAELRAKMAGWPQQKAAETNAAVQAAINPLRNKIVELKNKLIEAERKFGTGINQAAARATVGAAERIAELEARVVDLTRQLGAAKAKPEGPTTPAPIPEPAAPAAPIVPEVSVPIPPPPPDEETARPTKPVPVDNPGRH